MQRGSMDEPTRIYEEAEGAFYIRAEGGSIGELKGASRGKRREFLQRG